MEDGIKKYVRKNIYKEIRADLLNQLRINGTVNKYYENMVDDYMELWSTKCLLIEDIGERGVRVKYDNGGGQKGYKKNDSVDQLIKVNAQMLKLLSELGIKPAQTDGEDDEL